MSTFPPVPDWVPEGERKDWDKALWDAKLKRIDSRTTAEQGIDAEFFKAIFAVAQGAIERARTGAETVQKAAAAIAALYTPLLGVVFSVTDHPLPSRGIIPVLFLGVAIVSSTAYLAYLTRARPVNVLTPAGSPFARNVERARSLIEWTRRAAEHRGYLLRLSVVALGIGLAFLPAPFVSFDKPATTAAIAPTTSTATAPSITTPTVTGPDWPTPSKMAGSNRALQKVVYEAQVAEVAAMRKPPPSAAPIDTGDNGAWWLAALGAAAFMLLAPLMIDAAFGAIQSETP